MDKKSMVYKAENFENYIKWPVQQLCHRFRLKTTSVKLIVPRDRHTLTDGGNPDAPFQHFYSKDLPRLLPSTIEGTARIGNREYLVVIPKSHLFNQVGEEGIPLTLYGARGFVGGLNILNGICHELFTQEGVVEARSITYSDLIGTNNWVKTLDYRFKKDEYTPESYLRYQSCEEPMSLKKYPSWGSNSSGIENFPTSMPVPLMDKKSGNYWLASRIALPFATLKKDISLLRFSVGAFDNGYVCMDSSLFISGGPSFNNNHELLEWKQTHFIKPVIYVDPTYIGTIYSPLCF